MTRTSEGLSIENLTVFSQLLRQKGLTAGISETMDATRVIELIGLENRQAVRQALSAIYAKSKSQQRIFKETFDKYFVGEDTRRKQLNQKKQEREEQKKRQQEAEEELKYDGKPLELNSETKQAYANMTKDEREQLMRYLDFSTDNKRRSPFNERFMQKIIQQRLMLDDLPGYGAVEASQEQIELLDKNLSDIPDEEVPHIIALINRLVKQLNGSISRDYRRSGKSGRLDFRKTIHESLRTGGSFYKLRFKKRRRSKKRLLLLCDVSGSMLKFSQFAIRFIKSMSDVAESSDTYLFSEDVKKVSRFVTGRVKAFEEHVKESGLWGKGTDIGGAIEKMQKLRPSPLTGSTVMIILSDTRTVNTKNAEAQLKSASARVKKIIWMNPIPESKWANMKSVSAFKPYCRMLDCSTLNNLAKACAKLSGRHL